MIIDTSAIVAILRDEADAPALSKTMERAEVRRMSAATLVEVGVVVDRNQNPLLSGRLDAVAQAGTIVIEPVTVNQAHIARQAYRDFGKGRHRASLNFGDCFAYALAKEKGEPLLFKGDDFRHTDIERAEIDPA